MFIKNKYNKWYFNIIDRAKSRTLANDDYVEKHHIIPKSLGGSNNADNLVCLTAKEHFICHLLLTKMTAGVARTKMVYAAKEREAARKAAKARADAARDAKRKADAEKAARKKAASEERKRKAEAERAAKKALEKEERGRKEREAQIIGQAAIRSFRGNPTGEVRNPDDRNAQREIKRAEKEIGRRLTRGEASMVAD